MTQIIIKSLETALFLHKKGLIEQAIPIYKAVLDILPQNADALHLLGMALHQTGDSETGKDLISKAIHIDKNQPEFYTNLGQILENLERFNEAKDAYAKALRLDENLPDALFRLGQLELRQGQINESIRWLSKTIRLSPGHGLATMTLGNAYKVAGQGQSAIKLLTKATELIPLSHNVWAELGAASMELQQLDEAEAALKNSLILNPSLVESWNHLGFLHANLPDLECALNCFKTALLIEPLYHSPHAGLAEIEFLSDQIDKALGYSKKASVLAPGNFQIRQRRAIHLLAIGQIRLGWALRDARLFVATAIQHIGLPTRWDGSPLNDRTLVVTAEEGVGDELLFASCYHEVIVKSRHCFIECDERLVKTFQRCFPDATVKAVQRAGNRSKPKQFYHWLPKHPPVDLSIPSGSLFRYLRPNLASYEGKDRYIYADPLLKRKWNKNINQLGSGLKVGFCWRSMEVTRFRNINYTALDDWVDLLSTRKCEFISLQYGNDWLKEIVEFRNKFKRNIHIIDNVDLTNDFENIFAIASTLDLIISPSSSVSWIGGALGVPTWVLHIKPNFTQLGTNYFPGFPSMRSFPKQISDPWTICFDPIKAALGKMVQSTK